MPLVKRHVYGIETTKKVVTRLVSLSCWFEVMPYPDDMWLITVKPEMKRYLDSIISIANEQQACGVDYMAGQICMLPYGHDGSHR
jgi:hypothetical protein